MIRHFPFSTLDHLVLLMLLQQWTVISPRSAKGLQPNWEFHGQQPRVLRDWSRTCTMAKGSCQLLPAVPACINEMSRFWPCSFQSKRPKKGCSKLEVHGINPQLWSHRMKTVCHLHSNRRSVSASSSVSLPHKSDRLTGSIYERTYKYVVQSVSVLSQCCHTAVCASGWDTRRDGLSVGLTDPQPSTLGWDLCGEWPPMLQGSSAGMLQVSWDWQSQVKEPRGRIYQACRRVSWSC